MSRARPPEAARTSVRSMEVFPLNRARPPESARTAVRPGSCE